MAATVVQVASRERRIAGGDDAALVAAVRRGDDQAFEQLYHRYHRRIAAYIHGMVGDHGRAEDVAQDVFISALRRIRATDRPIAFKPWIYEIAKNACIDLFRRSRRVEEISFDTADGFAPADHRRLQCGRTPDEAMGEKESLEHLRGAFGGLSETHHAILVLREFEGLSYREIGERLGMTRAAVESTLFRARRRLSEEYEDLSSGARCTRVNGLIVTATAGALGLRDRRRLALHVAHCGPCRRRAGLAGLDTEGRRRPGPRPRIAAILPFPLVLGRRPTGTADEGAATPFAAGVHAPAVAQWSAQLSSALDPAIAGWAKAAVAAATIAVAGMGAGAVVEHRHDPDTSPRAALAAPGGPAVASAATADRHAAPVDRTVPVAATTPAEGADPATPEPAAVPVASDQIEHVTLVEAAAGRPVLPRPVAEAGPVDASPLRRIAPVAALADIAGSSAGRPAGVRPGPVEGGESAVDLVRATTSEIGGAVQAGAGLADEAMVAVAGPLVGG